MPEGDSVYRFAARIRPALTGKAILRASAQGPGPVPQVHRLLGAVCTDVRSHGKNMLISFDNGLSLRGHLRMYGTWHVYRPGEAWARPADQARLVLEVEDAVVVNFSAPVIELIEERALLVHPPIATLGPDLLDDDFDPAEAARRFRDPALVLLTIGDAIMDQRVMAGAGNIWKHEVLFRCGINPWRRVGELDGATLQTIAATARNLLRASAGKERDAIGRPLPRPTMWVYGRAGQPCRRCFSVIRSAPQGIDIRHTAWCPTCQPVVDGQAQLPPLRRRRGGSAPGFSG